MTNSAGLTVKDFARLAQMSGDEVHALVFKNPSASAVSGLKRRYSYANALEIEVARQLNDNSGIPLNEALRFNLYTAGVSAFLNNGDNVRGDFWFAVLASRNTWGSEPRGSWPVTGFGPKEYWSELHFTGSIGAIAGEISEWIGRDQAQHPDSDPARVVMANVSTADRRLRKRATDLGIEIIGSEFA